MTKIQQKMTERKTERMSTMESVLLDGLVMIRTLDDLIIRFKLLTVADLKKELRKVGLRPRGLKRDLVRQLAEKEYNRMVGIGKCG